MMVAFDPCFGNPALRPATLYTSETLEILCHNPDADKAVVVFDHRHVRDGQFTKIKPSEKITSAGFAYVTVATRVNDWFLSESLKDCQSDVSDAMSRYARVTGFGSSMGGYGALALSRAFRFNQVLLVSPQVTVFPDRTPYDPRFEEHAKHLDPSFDILRKDPRKGLGGVILYDPAQPHDRAHVAEITGLFPRLKRVPFSFVGHPALKLVNEQKQFGKIQDELISNQISARRLLKLHKSVRQNSPDYRVALNSYLKERQSRGETSRGFER